MRYYYVQLNDQNAVKGALETHAQISKPNMIQTDRFRSDLLDWKYENGQFYPPPPPPPVEG
jgi:hypothetical protein